MSLRSTSRDYANPHRPLPVTLLNALGRWAPHVSVLGLTPEALTREATRKEGLTDFGPPTLDEPLSRLCEALNAEAHLTPLGRIITHVRLVNLLRNRLRAQALWSAHPDIGSTPVRAPIVITGLQRTGTTFLHRLLAADPRLRSLRSWESLAPAPYRHAATPDPRRAEAHQAERALRYLAPDFFAVHPIDAEGVEEEVILLDHSLLSTLPEATMRVPSFSAWLETQDQTPAYHTLQRMLQLLAWQDPADRWVLKTPHHLEWLDTLFHVFPDAQVIHTHRDPVVTVASFCSMVAHGHGVFSDQVESHEIGATWLAKTGRMVDRAMATRAARADAGFVDVQYDDLITDPTATVARVYAFLGLEVPDDLPARIAAAREVNPQHRFGKHDYDAADFGLTPEAIAERFAAYRARFGWA